MVKKKYKCKHCKYEEKIESRNSKYCEVLCYQCPDCHSGVMTLRDKQDEK